MPKKSREVSHPEDSQRGASQREDGPILICGHDVQMVVSAAQYKRDRTARWFLSGSVPQVTRGEFRNAVDLAFASWSSVANVSAEPVTSAADADLIIQVGRIDGAGGTLAWMELPHSGVQNGRFDSSERWVLRLGVGVPSGVIDLHRVIRHELGHFWGLPHASRDSGDLMAPFYNPNVDEPGRWSTSEMVARYGAPLPPPPPPGVDEPAQMVIIGRSGRETARFDLTRVA